MSMLKMSEQEIDIELMINNSSIAMLEQELLNQARKEAKYQRLAAYAGKNVAKLQLDLDVVTAEIIKELQLEAEAKKKPIASSAVSELRKTHIPADPRYIKIRSKLIDAYEESNLLNGLVSAWISRGYRLQELVKLADRTYYSTTMYGEKYTTAKEKMDRAGEAMEY